MYKKLLIFACSFFSVLFINAQGSARLFSPDSSLQFEFSISSQGIPGYNILYKQSPLVLNSVLGLDGWEKGFTLSEVTFSKQDTTWKPVYGERSSVRDHFEKMMITLLQDNNKKRKLQLEVRAYNEGIA